jgi:hypothetical protein
MTRAIVRSLDFVPADRGRLSRKIFAHTIPGALILASSAWLGTLMLPMHPAAAPKEARAPAVAPAVNVASNAHGLLFDPGFFSNSTPVALSQGVPRELDVELVSPAPFPAIAEPEKVSPIPLPAAPQLSESAPLPPPRPSELALPASRGAFQIPSRHFAQQNRKTIFPGAPGDNRTFFEKLFGMAQSSRPALAYAAAESLPDNARRLTSPAPPRPDRWTAVYDVAAHTVYMPDGTRLEAHSGLGNMLDDPRHVNEQNRGATPPNIYELEPRAQLFHGVQALRLKPVGGGIYGRTGLLAHTYMLGPNGDSNGCVSFRNYNAFLQAFQNGEVKHLVVVARS